MHALCDLDAMRVKGLVWLGIPAESSAAAVRFFGQTLGLEVAFDEGNTVELAAGNGNRIHLSGPGERYFDFCRGRRRHRPAARGGRPGPGARRTAPRRRGTTRRAEVGRHLDLAHLPSPDGNTHSLSARTA